MLEPGEMGAVPKAQTQTQTQTQTPKELVVFRKIAPDVKGSIDIPPFKPFPSRQELLRRQGVTKNRVVKPILNFFSRFMQLDGLEEEDEEGRMEDDPEVPIEEEKEEDKTYEVPMKRKFTFFPSKKNNRE